MDSWAVVVAQLVEQSLPISEVRGSNPVIGKILYYTFTVNCMVLTIIKKKTPGMAHFSNKMDSWEQLWSNVSRLHLWWKLEREVRTRRRMTSRRKTTSPCPTFHRTPSTSFGETKIVRNEILSPMLCDWSRKAEFLWYGSFTQETFGSKCAFHFWNVTFANFFRYREYVIWPPTVHPKQIVG